MHKRASRSSLTFQPAFVVVFKSVDRREIFEQASGITVIHGLRRGLDMNCHCGSPAGPAIINGGASGSEIAGQIPIISAPAP
jgi:hypothetical protein